MKKICIVHDSFCYIGGAERVLLELIELFPHADVYIPLTKKQFLPLIQKKLLGELHTSLLGNIPLPISLVSVLKPLVYVYWKTLDLNQYSLIISSSHSWSSKSVIKPHKAKHLCYLHTPPRFLYQEYNEMSWLKISPWKELVSPLINFAKKLDFSDAQNPDKILVNSKTVQQRVLQYYKRKSTVLYPPVQTADNNFRGKPNYYLCVSRLVKQKGLKLAIEACNLLNEKLVIIGAGPESSRLKKIAGPTISFVGFAPDAKMANYYQHAKALLYCSIDEDFGLVPLEAQSRGVPVIAFKSGGASETVIEHKTGLFFHKFTVNSLVRAMRQLDHVKILAGACRAQAKLFDRQVFRYKMRQHVAELLKEN